MFKPYTFGELDSIIRQRELSIGAQFFDPQAINLCARKVAKKSGDVRAALGLCEQALTTYAARQNQSTTSSRAQGHCVTVTDMLKVVMSNFAAPKADRMALLPRVVKLVLYCFFEAMVRKGGEKREFSMGELFKYFQGLRRPFNLKEEHILSVLTFENCLQTLMCNGVLRQLGSKVPTTNMWRRRIEFTAPFDHVRNVLSQDPYFEKHVSALLASASETTGEASK